jgi:hypothetical protein
MFSALVPTDVRGIYKFQKGIRLNLKRLLIGVRNWIC